MRTSESTGQLMQALAAAQAKFPKIAKDKTAEVQMKSGGKFSYGYADLASVLDAIRPVLAEHKIATVQAPDLDDDGRLLLISRLAHESDEWIEAHYPLPNNASAQEMGSAITYARRYSICALAGVTAEDDDDGQRAPKSSGRSSSGKTAESKSANGGSIPPRPAAQPAQQSPATAVTNGSRDDLIARLKEALPEDHPKKSVLSSMSPKQLEALAKSLSVEVETNPQAVFGEVRSEQVSSASQPEGGESVAPAARRSDAAGSPSDWSPNLLSEGAA